MESRGKDIEVILDGTRFGAREGETILDVAVREGVSIPTLCHDPILKPFASCFLCVVEVKGMKGLQPSCCTPVHDAMEIITSDEKIRKARRTALELLLSNHYADCVGPCRLTCPAGVNVQGYISLVEKGMYHEAIALIKEANPLPAICGRVCVRPCELVCRRQLLENGCGVGIDYLKRYAADKDLEKETFIPVAAPETGKKIAIIGAGPAGLAAAYWLRLKGHTCHIFEAAPLPGGWLRYGIPGYRLPNEILDKEIKEITDLGVKIFCGQKLGDGIDYRNINLDYDATVLTVGSQLGTRLGCKGDDADGVMPGIYFLRDMELTGIKPDLADKAVIVVGGGNTAMDCCRTAVRCNAESVKVVYRRSEAEMPANYIEIEESKAEGVEYLFLTNPVEVIKNENGFVTELVLQRMSLGEPDASGRRRPVEIPGSEFRIKADLVLAAIGQKTDTSFLENINSCFASDAVRVNKWGNIEAAGDTQQTGVPNIFAAGDAVTGPDTIIGAIGQAHRAADSCHSYLSGEEVKLPEKIFISRRDNFREPVAEDLSSRFARKPRAEMPELDGKDRAGFREVELGITDEYIIREEASRCLECGCTAFGRCNLQKYATEYGAGQERFKGDFLSVSPDYHDPFIAFDHNKCILCGRCVRICHEVAGADALDFQNRGYHTIIGTGNGQSLKDSGCTRCGLCLTTCPTGAISDNTPFKPGPVPADSFVTPDFTSSSGEWVRLYHNSSFFLSAAGEKTDSNPAGLAGAEAKFSYRILNHERITKPLLKIGGSFRPISFSDAFSVISDKIKKSSPEHNVFFAGASLTNEEQLLVRRLAQKAVGTPYLGSFHYPLPETGLSCMPETDLLPGELSLSDSFFVIGTDILNSYQTAGFRVFNNMFRNGYPMMFVTASEKSAMQRKATSTITVSSYYHFIKAVNKYIIDNNLSDKENIRRTCAGYESYAAGLLAEEHGTPVLSSGTGFEGVKLFAEKLCEGKRPAVIFAESDVDPFTAAEIRNMWLLSGKTGMPGSGLLCLKTCPNSQGLIDNGITGNVFPDLSAVYKNIFVFGEDPVGCATDKKAIKSFLSEADFLVVQDLFMTWTARMADLVLPATFIFESGGSYTSFRRTMQITGTQHRGPSELTGCQLIASIIECLGIEQPSDPEIIRKEQMTLNNLQAGRASFTATTCYNPDNKMFNYGASSLTAMLRELISSGKPV